jgi:hypothetical protein
MDNLQRFNDEEMAEAATRMQKNAVVTLQYKQQLAKLGKTEAQINADANVIELERKANDDALKLETLMAKKVETVTSSSIKPQVVGLTPKERLEASQSAAKDWQDVSKPEREAIFASKATLNLAKEARTNPAATAPLLTNFIRSFGGEKGALSEGDVQRMKLDPSLAGKTADWIEKNFTGKLSEESIGYLESAVKGKMTELDASLATKAKDYSKRIGGLGLNPHDVLPGEDIKLISGKVQEKKLSQDEILANKKKNKTGK